MNRRFFPPNCERCMAALWWLECAAALGAAAFSWSGRLSPLASSWSAAGLGIVLMAASGLIASIMTARTEATSTARFRIVGMAASPGIVLGALLSPTATLSTVFAVGVLAAAVAGLFVVPPSRVLRARLDIHRPPQRRATSPAASELRPAASEATAAAPALRLMDELEDETSRDSSPKLSIFVPPEEEGSAEDARNITQRIVRRQEDALETFEGSFRVTFAPGQRQASLHVPFLPPFAATPELETSIGEDESSVRHKVAAVFRYGARIELRRSEPREPLTVDVIVEGSAPCQPSRAA